MIDIGVNLTNKRFDKDREEVISRAKAIGVENLFITGTSVNDSLAAIELIDNYKTLFPNFLYSTAGIHPHYADNVDVDYLSEIKKMIEQPEVIAIGECGLDFNRNFSKPEQQINVFNEQIQLASDLSMPLFLHQRDAFDTWFKLLEPYLNKVPAIITHCFTGNREELKHCIKAGMYIGITGWICDEKRGKDLQEIVKLIPKNRLLVETDAPYLTPKKIIPKPKNGRNEPIYLPYIIEKIANIVGENPQDLAYQTSKNSRTAFNLK